MRFGEEAILRLLRNDEPIRLGKYFAGLSAETKRVYGPHPFNQETADSICETLDHNAILRMLATTMMDGKIEEEIIGYFLLKHGVWDNDSERYSALNILLNPEEVSTLAPSVLDGYQDKGLGSQIMLHVLDYARNIGKKRIVLWGGVREDNPRAQHFYRKHGFVKVGEFLSGPEKQTNNYDMILEL